MERSSQLYLVFSIFLVIGVCMTGCSDSQDQDTDTPVTATTAAALFTAGDIVRSATGSESPAWLIIGYDSAADSYTRALIYRNTDGTWGYRVNAKTETSERAVLEKVYTIRITHVSVDAVRTSAPTTVTTEVTWTTTRTTTATTATTTTASTARPSIRGMDPDEGEAGSTVTTEITGSDFVSGLTAKLRRAGSTSITATEVDWYSSSSLTCTFDIPDSAKVGPWDIVVTNPNGLSGEYTNYFTVRGNETASG
jgi:hypothetical protein